ncbi:MAG: TetR/AcrR family transcriptional regulator [Promethearchaeota archaeon]
MTKQNPSRKPARSTEDKKRQFQKIIEEGRKLFVSRGTHGFNTRALAKRVNMSQGNLYNYIQSKRELWIAIRHDDIKKFKEDMEHIIDEYKGSYISLFEKLLNFYLDFAKDEYRRFQMMFLIPAPSSKKVGPIELSYEVIDPIDTIKRVVKEAIDLGEIKNCDVNNFSYYLYALAQGAFFVEQDLRSHQKIYEPIEIPRKQNSIENFRKFLIKKIIEAIKP